MPEATGKTSRPAAPFERAAVAAALAPLDLPPMLGGMGAEELLSLMF